MIDAVVVSEAELEEEEEDIADPVGKAKADGKGDCETLEVDDAEPDTDAEDVRLRLAEKGRTYSTSTPKLPPLHAPLPAPPFKYGAPFLGVGNPSATEAVPHTTTPPAPAPEQ